MKYNYKWELMAIYRKYLFDEIQVITGRFPRKLQELHESYQYFKSLSSPPNIAAAPRLSFARRFCFGGRFFENTVTSI